MTSLRRACSRIFNFLIQGIFYLDIISSFFSTPAAAMAGIRVADAQVSGAVQINAHPNSGFTSGAIEVLRRRRRASRAVSAVARSVSRGLSHRRGRSSRRRAGASHGSAGAHAAASASPKRGTSSHRHIRGTSSHVHARAASAKPPTHTKKMEFCVQDEAMMRNPDPAIRAAAIARAKELGATHIRMMLFMQDMHPCRGAEAAERLAIYEAAV